MLPGGPFRHTLRVRLNECDTQGIVFNANYLIFVDVAVTELWRELSGSYSELVAGGTDFCVAESHVLYLSPARAEEELDVVLTVTHLGRTSLVLRAVIERDRVLADCELRYVFVEPASLEGDSVVITPIPEHIRQQLATMTETGAIASRPMVGRQPAISRSIAS
jgi:acyl-CoA thioester hydrolase